MSVEGLIVNEGEKYYSSFKKYFRILMSYVKNIIG